MLPLGGGEVKKSFRNLSSETLPTKKGSFSLKVSREQRQSQEERRFSGLCVYEGEGERESYEGGWGVQMTVGNSFKIARGEGRGKK